MKRLLPFLFLLFTAASCSKKDELNSVQPRTVTDNGKIADAKQWFTSTYATSAGKRKELDWSKAVLENRQGESRVYVPLTYTDRKFLAGAERFRLLITTNSSGAKSAHILHYMADNAYYKQHQAISMKDFTGIITEYDWNDKFEVGYRYKNAQIVGEVSPISNDAYRKPVDSKKTVGTLDYDCTTLTVVYYSQACSGGTCGEATEVYRETFSSCTSGGSGGNSGGGGDGGYGGGGGGSGPAGGGGGPGDCGDMLVCPDGTPNSSLDMNNGFLVPLQISTSQSGLSANHIEATLKIESGNITNITSHMSGLTGGATYVQTDWVQNSAIGNLYTFSFAFHTNYSLTIFGIGDIAAGNTVIAHVTYNLVNGSMNIFFEKP